LVGVGGLEPPDIRRLRLLTRYRDQKAAGHARQPARGHRRPVSALSRVYSIFAVSLRWSTGSG